MSANCNIEFENNPSKAVYSGQLLRGNVHLTLTEITSVRNISLTICGEARSRWRSGSGDDRETYKGREDYLNERIYLVRGQKGKVDLTPGSYNYPFECALPLQLPASFEGTFGHIRYTACVYIENSSWPKKIFEMASTVLRTLDLNSIPALREPVPVIAEVRKTFQPCCLLCCYKSNPLDIIARVPVNGYTPGQTINVQIQVNNKSDQPVSNFKVQLINQILYRTHRSNYDKKHETVVVSEEKTQGCDFNSDANLSLNIVVPSISPTDDTTSRIIKFEYSVRVIATVAAFHINPTLLLPIVIGSIPIVNNNLPGAPGESFSSTATLPKLG